MGPSSCGCTQLLGLEHQLTGCVGGSFVRPRRGTNYRLLESSCEVGEFGCLWFGQPTAGGERIDACLVGRAPGVAGFVCGRCAERVRAEPERTGRVGDVRAAVGRNPGAVDTVRVGRVAGDVDLLDDRLGAGISAVGDSRCRLVDLERPRVRGWVSRDADGSTTQLLPVGSANTRSAVTCCTETLSSSDSVARRAASSLRSDEFRGERTS